VAGANVLDIKENRYYLYKAHKKLKPLELNGRTQKEL